MLLHYLEYAIARTAFLSLVRNTVQTMLVWILTQYIPTGTPNDMQCACSQILIEYQTTQYLPILLLRISGRDWSG
jgi:hypothetical protein